MKKWILGLACFLSTSSIFALPVYNPAEPVFFCSRRALCNPCFWAFNVGYRGDFVTNRIMGLRNQTNVRDFKRAVKEFSLTTNAAQVTLNLAKVWDIYGWAGATKNTFEVDTSFIGPLGFTEHAFKGNTFKDLSYGIGTRVIVWRSRLGCACVALDAQYEFFRAPIDTVLIDGIPIEDLIDETHRPRNFKLRYEELQFTFSLSYRICSFVPYAGLKYSHALAQFRGPVINITGIPTDIMLNLRSRHRIGFVTGITLVEKGWMHVTAEGRWEDERAYTIAAEVRY